MGGVILLGLVFSAILYLVLLLIRKPAPRPHGPGRSDVVLRLDEERASRRTAPQPDADDPAKPE